MEFTQDILELDEFELGTVVYFANVSVKDNWGNVQAHKIVSVDLHNGSHPSMDTVNIGVNDFEQMKFTHGEWLTVGSRNNLSFQPTSTSLNDRGIIPNTYNDHRVFTSVGEAQLYVQSKLGGYVRKLYEREEAEALPAGHENLLIVA